ncbi:MAG: hypothetical protein MZV70_40275 [Desulfobacterales bacterium]|nr:hypothetical protein [Desulfobacterales bacterium]
MANYSLHRFTDARAAAGDGTAHRAPSTGLSTEEIAALNSELPSAAGTSRCQPLRDELLELLGEIPVPVADHAGPHRNLRHVQPDDRRP